MSGFFSGSFDPFWPHAILLTVAIAASFAVAAGIVMENPKWSLANALVVGGVAIEAACTLLLFGFDEGISGKLQSKVVIATDRATDAGEALAEFMLPRSLSGEQQARLAKVAKLYPSLSFVTVANPESEPWSFVMGIATELKSDGWNWIPCPGGTLQPLDPRPASCASILVGVQINAPSDRMDVAHALADAIEDPHVVGMDNVRPVADPNAKIIVIMAGSKR